MGYKVNQLRSELKRKARYYTNVETEVLNEYITLKDTSRKKARLKVKLEMLTDMISTLEVLATDPNELPQF